MGGKEEEGDVKEEGGGGWEREGRRWDGMDSSLYL